MKKFLTLIFTIALIVSLTLFLKAEPSYVSGSDSKNSSFVDFLAEILEMLTLCLQTNAAMMQKTIKVVDFIPSKSLKILRAVILAYTTVTSAASCK